MSDIRASTMLAPARRTLPALHRMLVRSQVTRGRVGVLAVLGVIAVGMAALSRRVDSEQGEVALFVVADYGIGLLVPLAALLLAQPMFGNLVEDRLLVYLWLKPAPRWHLALAAMTATATPLLPATVVPLVVACLVSGQTGLVGATALAAGLGGLAYGSMFLWLGLRFGFGLWAGLAYVVAWENIFARLSDGTARLSIRSYLMSILDWGTNLELELADRNDVAAVVVPVALVIAGVALTARTLARRDID